jgi:hypothetical protein
MTVFMHVLEIGRQANLMKMHNMRDDDSVVWQALEGIGLIPLLRVKANNFCKI